MSSERRVDRRREPLADLERDLPTSAADIAALRRARIASRALDPAGRARLLAGVGHPSYEILLRRRLLDGEPFEL